MKAFPFDAEDPLGGDHEFYAPDDAIDYKEGDSFDVLVERKNAERYSYAMEQLAEGTITQEEYEEEVANSVQIIGFWLIEDDKLALVSSVWEDCGNDSATYQCNAAAKRLVQKLSTAIITASAFAERVNRN